MTARFACLLILVATASVAQPEWWSFESHPYFDPLIAGVREPHISALVPARFDEMPLMVEKGTRLGWDIDLGGELPIFGRESAANTGDVGDGEWGWGVWIPIDFHMIEDFRDESAPIVNTDYRFGAMFKYRRGLANERWLAARLHVGHESTHLGDEFAIHAQTSPAFERINVSWEYLDATALYEWRRGQRVWSVRGGVTTTLPFGDSYYQTGPGSVTESRIGPVTESTNWWDPHLGIDFKREELFFNDTFDLYASTEIRWRSVYDYHKADPDDAEDRQTSVNLIVGIKKTGSGRGGIGRASPFFRFYHGVNPHGQFRSQKSFTEWGFGVRLVR